MTEKRSPNGLKSSPNGEKVAHRASLGKDHKRNIVHECEFCNYKTNKISNYKKHLKSKKHMRKKSSQIEKSHHKYKKVIPKEEKVIPNTEKVIPNTEKSSQENEKLLREVINQQQQQIQTLIDVVKEIKSTSSTTNNNTNCNNTINNNNTINIQLFLNENCKDALPLEDFIKNVQFQVEDILYKSNNQLIKDGFATKLEKEILNTPINERPIHVADNKRGIFHVKIKEDGEGSTWVKDETSSELLKSMQDARTKAYVASYDAITNDGTKADLQTCLMKQKLQKELTEDSISKNRKLIKKLAKNLPNIKEDIKELEK